MVWGICRTFNQCACTLHHSQLPSTISAVPPLSYLSQSEASSCAGLRSHCAPSEVCVKKAAKQNDFFI